MAIKNKIWYSEQVLRELNSELRNRDEKIDQREVIIRLDAIVNTLAKLNVFESWNVGEKHIDDQFLTTWDGHLNSWLPVVDPTNNSTTESYVTLPVNYAALPKNAGIVQIYLEKDYFDPIAILSAQEVPTIRNTMGGNLQGRIGVYPRGGRIYFIGRRDIGRKYGGVGLQLVIRDSAQIADDALYPIDATMEHRVIEETVNWFRNRNNQGKDVVRDNVSDTNVRGNG